MFPDTFSGWLLLQRSGLEATERAQILGRTNDSLRQIDIEKALQTQWMDADLRERDKKKGVDQRYQKGFVTYDGSDSEKE